MNRLRTLLVGLTLVAGGALGTSAAPAQAAAPGSLACGTTLTADTVLDGDLLDCPGDGLVIGADNITLDLNGHLLRGDRSERVECPQDLERRDVGVSNLAGHSGVTIKGGSISDFSFGVYLQGAADNSLADLTLSANLLGGAELHDLAAGRVERSTMTQNGLTAHGAGLNISGSTGLVIEGNTLSENGALGLRATAGSSKNSITTNQFADNPESGIFLDGSSNEITGNTLARNGAGILLSGDGNRVSANVITDVVWCGYLGCGSAIQVTSGLDNLISLNVIQRAPAGIDLESFEGRLEGTRVSGNVVDSTRGAGIAVDVSNGDGTLVSTVLERDVVTRTGTDGFDVQAGSTTLTGNLAFGNESLGIKAVAGVTDGGGNYAVGNGDAEQCTNVQCGGTGER